MKNLKIVFKMKTPYIVDRYMTIDSLLLNVYFNKLRRENKIGKNEFVNTEDYLDRISSILEVKNGVVSGSIWYIPKEEQLLVQNISIIKKIDSKEFGKYTNHYKIDSSRGEFKAYKFGLESFLTKSIYFYIRGDKKQISQLLNEVKFIGKKRSYGYGEIEDINIIEIDKDKSFMLDEFTAAKPLPCSDFDVKTKRVAFFKRIAPYWDKVGQEACYMPPTAFVELQDTTFNKNYTALTDINYTSATKFTFSVLADCDISKFIKKGIEKIEDNTKLPCAACGSIEKVGLKGNIKKMMPNTFNDFPFFGKENFICKNCLCSLIKERDLGNSLIKKDGIVYIQGSKMEVDKKLQKEWVKELFLNINAIELPFVISYKSSTKAQHTLFKNKLSISNAILPISFGDEFRFVDIDLLKEAIKEMEYILNTNKCIKKLHLLNFEKSNDKFPKLSRNCLNEENTALLNNFYKKYDKGIRRVLNKIF